MKKYLALSLASLLAAGAVTFVRTGDACA